MSMFKMFSTDESKEQNGVDIKYAANEDGSIPSFRVRRRGERNQQYAKALKRETEPHRRSIELGTFDDLLSRHLLMKVFCDTVLIGWENIQNEQDEPIAFSPQAAMELFKKLPDLYTDLLQQSENIANFRIDGLEKERKN